MEKIDMTGFQSVFFKLDVMHAFENLELRPTDIILNTMPKAGTNFLFRNNFKFILVYTYVCL
eukprot:UN02472